MSGIVYIVSAPSGSGKSTLTADLLRSVPDLEFSISYTTRKPRGSEQNGREYYFVTRDEFERMIQNGDFLEHAKVFGDYYGTSRRFLRDAERRGKDLLLDIDVQGAAQVKHKMPEAVSIFILPPNRKELESRLKRRTQAEKLVEEPQRRRSEAEREEVIRRRLEAAGKEIENYRNYDYILVNDQLEQSCDRLRDIVLAERAKRSGNQLVPADERHLANARRSLLSNVREQVEGILESFAQPATSAEERPK